MLKSTVCPETVVPSRRTSTTNVNGYRVRQTQDHLSHLWRIHRYSHHCHHCRRRCHSSKSLRRGLSPVWIVSPTERCHTSLYRQYRAHSTCPHLYPIIIVSLTVRTINMPVSTIIISLSYLGTLSLCTDRWLRPDKNVLQGYHRRAQIHPHTTKLITPLKIRQFSLFSFFSFLISFFMS